eukprot:scaffold2.g6829.t1
MTAWSGRGPGGRGGAARHCGNQQDEAEAPGPSGRDSWPPLASLTQGVVTAATGAGITMVLRRALTNTGMATNLGQPGGKDGGSVACSASAAVLPPTAPAAAPPPPPPPPPQAPDQKPAHDVLAGAMARAASQSTIHPLDTMKVRMQAGRAAKAGAGGAPKLPPRPAPAVRPSATAALAAQRSLLTEVKGLYKGVVGAAAGAGIIIGTYFAFYSTTKRFLKERTSLSDGATAFTSGAVAALGSSVVKVPLAVCIRSVQAGIYPNLFAAARSIVARAGVRGLFTGFLPTVLEDVPDMAVKFAVYETLRSVHARLQGGRPANVAEDLVIGGFAGAAAAAATTPLDVVKTVMMCTASSRPTFASACRAIMAEGKGLRPFFRGVGPRALSNGLNSAIFFCFFEAIRQLLMKQQLQQELARRAAAAAAPARPARRLHAGALARARLELASAAGARPQGSPAACLSLALPLPGPRRRRAAAAC